MSDPLCSNTRKKGRTKNIEPILEEEGNSEDAENSSENQAGEGVQVEKEKRCKKRNERPPEKSDAEDQVPISSIVKVATFALPTAFEKPVKTASKATKVMTSKPIMNSTFEAQSLPLSTPEINLTKPISMILPNAQPETVNVSSTSEDTLSYSTFQELMKGLPSKRTPTTSKNQEVVFEDNFVLNQHSSHLFADVFVSSTMNFSVESLNVAIPSNTPITSTTTTIPTIVEQTAEPQEETRSPNLVDNVPELNRQETINLPTQQETLIPNCNIPSFN
jgi:hypothetical protein